MEQGQAVRGEGHVRSDRIEEEGFIRNRWVGEKVYS